MATARGSQTELFLYDETTYGSDPGSPDGKQVYPSAVGVKVSQNLIQDPTLTNDREAQEPAKGNVDVAESFTMQLAAEDIGIVLKHAIGTPTTYRPVSNQPTNVTGVTVNNAQSTSATGNGTLSFTLTGTLLAWAEAGDSAGTGVDVSAGGDFTLASNNGKQLYVTVSAGSLPGGNQSDTDITVVAAYEHIFEIGSLPTSFMLEKDHGSNISGSGRFEKFNGCRIASASFSMPQEGYASVQVSVKGANSTLASSALDSTPNDYGHTSFSAFNSTSIQEGGSGVTNITEMKITVNNNLDEGEHTLGNQGVRTGLAEGMAEVSGSLTGLFRSNALLTKANADTETSLTKAYSRGNGYGTDGNEYIAFNIRQMKYERTSPGIEGPQGVRETYNFRGYKSGTTGSLKVTLRNAVSSI